MPRQPKLFRRFNSKLYVRGGTYTSKERANQVKHNYHGHGIHALITPQANGSYTVWRRKN